MHKKNKNFAKFWNSTRKVIYKSTLPLSVDTAQNPTEISKLFAGHFKVDSLPVERVMSGAPVLDGVSKIIQFTPKHIATVMKQTSRGKSPGHDGLSVEHILYADDEIYSVLCKLYNLCLQHGYLPRNLMKTVVVAIPKNRTGDLSSLKNYRPISLGTILGKVLERLIHPRLMKNVRISDAQFGLRPGTGYRIQQYSV